MRRHRAEQRGRRKLAALGGGDKKLEKWHVRSYRLGLENNLPVFTAQWRPEEEFRIGDFVAILCEIPPDGTASKLLTGIPLLPFLFLMSDMYR